MRPRSGPRRPRPRPARRAAHDSAAPGPPPGKVRIQKFLSDAGVASRRHAEEMIRDGRVAVNGETVHSLPAFIDPNVDAVFVNGDRVRLQSPEYFIVHKPPGVVCTDRDPAGRPRAVDLLPPLRAKLFPVGRLDAESTGLLIMTNDGELAQRVTHPRFGVEKVYRAEVAGDVSGDIIARLRKGVYLAEGLARAAYVKIIHRGRDQTVLEITLREGRNRQVRRMLARLGHKVYRLKRIRIGPISLKGLPMGAARRLTLRELDDLRRYLDETKSHGGDDAPPSGAPREARRRFARTPRSRPQHAP